MTLPNTWYRIDDPDHPPPKGEDDRVDIWFTEPERKFGHITLPASARRVAACMWDKDRWCNEDFLYVPHWATVTHWMKVEGPKE